METGLERKLNLSNVEGGSITPFVNTEDREQQKRGAEEGVSKNRGCKIEGVLKLPKVYKLQFRPLERLPLTQPAQIT